METVKPGELRKMSDVVKKANYGVKEHGSSASFSASVQAGGSNRVRSDLPAQQKFRTESIGARFGKRRILQWVSASRWDQGEGGGDVQGTANEILVKRRRSKMVAIAATSTLRGRPLESRVRFKASMAPRLNEKRLVEETPKPNDKPRTAARFKA